MSALRHKWSAPERFLNKSERSCIREGCDIVKVTRHEGDQHWQEFWRNGERLRVEGTPPCEGCVSKASTRSPPAGGRQHERLET